MNENNVLQQELNFRLSLLRLVTNTPFSTGADAPTSPESRQIENLCALVETGSRPSAR
jgi:hypothetical protein